MEKRLIKKKILHMKLQDTYLKFTDALITAGIHFDFVSKLL